MEALLWQQIVLFAENQFSQEVIDFLATRILEMGGTISSKRDGSDILLINPTHPLYKQEIEHDLYLTKTYPHIPQPKLIPYHWISNIYYLKKRIPPDKIEIISPLFVFPSQLDNYRPIKSWVSVNVSREQDETPEQARDHLISKLECSGSISVNKRSQADLLVIDESSQFSKKVYEEKRKYNRSHQKIVERDWIDNTLKSKKLIWNKVEDEDDNDNDSFLGEDDIQNLKENGKGPGRPTGQPRVDYTPQDDDFLCRYLAAHHPSGSWSSRKTYQNLVGLANQYPISQRHTAQSWHERFKKNPGPFERRVHAFIRDGVNGTLKTRTEREKAKLAKVASQGQVAGPAENDKAAQENEAGPSRSTATQIPVSSQNAKAGKRKLVELDDEDSLPPVTTTTNERDKRIRRDKDLVAARPPEKQAEVPQQPKRFQGVQEIQRNQQTQKPAQPLSSEPQKPEQPQQPQIPEKLQQPISPESLQPPRTTNTTDPTTSAEHRPDPKTVSPVPANTESQTNTSLLAGDQPGAATTSPAAEPQIAQSSTSVPAQITTDKPVRPVEEESLTDLLPTSSQIGSRPSEEDAKNRTTDTGNRTVDTDLVERDLDDSQAEGSVATSPARGDIDVNEEDESQRGEATQAILADFARAQAAARQVSEPRQPVEEPVKPRKSVRVEEEADKIIPPEPETRPFAPIQPQEPASPRRRPTQPPHTAHSSPVHIILSPPKRSSNMQPLQERHSAPAAIRNPTLSSDGTATMSIPLQLEVNIRAIPLEVNIPQSNEEPSQKAIEAGPSVETPQRISQKREVNSSDTPSKTPRKSLLQEHLLASASRRIRTLEKLSGGSNHKRHSVGYGEPGPDMVFRETSIPPRPIPITPSTSPSPVVQNRREVSPELTQKEKNELAIKGKNLIQKSIEEYKIRITNLSKKYGMTNNQIVAFINNNNDQNGRGKTKGKSSGERYWQDIERSLRERK